MKMTNPLIFLRGQPGKMFKTQSNLKKMNSEEKGTGNTKSGKGTEINTTLKRKGTQIQTKEIPLLNNPTKSS